MSINALFENFTCPDRNRLALPYFLQSQTTAGMPMHQVGIRRWAPHTVRREQLVSSCAIAYGSPFLLRLDHRRALQPLSRNIMQRIHPSTPSMRSYSTAVLLPT